MKQGSRLAPVEITNFTNRRGRREEGLPDNNASFLPPLHPSALWITFERTNLVHSGYRSSPPTFSTRAFNESTIKLEKDRVTLWKRRTLLPSLEDTR